MTDAVEKLSAHIAQIGAEAARIQANSAECLWVCHHIAPPKLPDVVSSTAELNPLRHAEKKADADAVMRGGRETRLDYSAARPPANGRGR